MATVNLDSDQIFKVLALALALFPSMALIVWAAIERFTAVVDRATSSSRRSEH